MGKQWFTCTCGYGWAWKQAVANGQETYCNVCGRSWAKQIAREEGKGGQSRAGLLECASLARVDTPQRGRQPGNPSWAWEGQLCPLGRLAGFAGGNAEGLDEGGM